jgi:hypothetical protein
MDSLPPPLAFFLLVFSGWINRQQQAVIDYLREENRVFRAAYGPQRVRLTDDQRRRLAVKGNALGRRRLANVAGIATPDTILRWYRRLVAAKYNGSAKRRPGRPSTAPDLSALIARLAKLEATRPSKGTCQGSRVRSSSKRGSPRSESQSASCAIHSRDPPARLTHRSSSSSALSRSPMRA